MNTSGRFIVFEGGDGGGKSTQIKRLETWLKNKGYTVVMTREPGGTQIGERMRDILLDPSREIDPVTEAFLLATGRSDNVHRVIQPALQAGHIVLCDRFVDSSLIYQGFARGLGYELVAQINAPAIRGLQPSLTVLLDVDPVEGISRTAKQGELDRLELAGSDFHATVRARYLELAKQSQTPYAVVDANQPMDAVYDQIVKAVESILPPATN